MVKFRVSVNLLLHRDNERVFACLFLIQEKQLTQL